MLINLVTWKERALARLQLLLVQKQRSSVPARIGGHLAVSWFAQWLCYCLCSRKITERSPVSPDPPRSQWFCLTSVHYEIIHFYYQNSRILLCVSGQLSMPEAAFSSLVGMCVVSGTGQEKDSVTPGYHASVWPCQGQFLPCTLFPPLQAEGYILSTDKPFIKTSLCFPGLLFHVGRWVPRSSVPCWEPAQFIDVTRGQDFCALLLKAFPTLAVVSSAAHLTL